ncbi:MAG: hypothetical protein U1E97_09765 [Alphaproteobacteria bacterium]
MIDDVVPNEFHETVDPQSARIVLLSPWVFGQRLLRRIRLGRRDRRQRRTALPGPDTLCRRTAWF